MHFLAAREETGCTTGHLLEESGSGSKIDKGVAVLFREVRDIDDRSGLTEASGCWANKQPLGEGFGWCQVMVKVTRHVR